MRGLATCIGQSAHCAGSEEEVLTWSQMCLFTHQCRCACNGRWRLSQGGSVAVHGASRWHWGEHTWHSQVVPPRRAVAVGWSCIGPALLAGQGACPKGHDLAQGWEAGRLRIRAAMALNTRLYTKQNVNDMFDPARPPLPCQLRVLSTWRPHSADLQTIPVQTGDNICGTTWLEDA